jgi:hypothetical protein
MNDEIHAASFRDPSGFLFSREGRLFRQVNQCYQADYDQLISSGLYQKLVASRYLVTHDEVNIPPAKPSLAYKIIEPLRVPFISYPYEWCFSQLKDAALLTLRIQKIALKSGMSLKDASAYNIQFCNGRPQLIDTLSFEVYEEGKPWVAYRQFCQHFLAPLALMAKTDIRLNQLLRIYIDGIPLDLASSLLPRSTWLNFGLLSHIHLHARAQTKYADADLKEVQQGKGMSKQSLTALIDNLANTVKKLSWQPEGTEWGDYYDITNYSETAFEHKKNLLVEWLDRVSPKMVWDLGANRGLFTRLASERGIYAISFDIDPAAVEQNYKQAKSGKEKDILPLILDLTNPSPALGWHNRERVSFPERAPAEMVFALALVHHLAISNNVPMDQLADFFCDVSQWLVIEFIPKRDSQVQRLLRNRVDIFEHYTEDDFERTFGDHFVIHEKVKLQESERSLYLMERRG